MASRFPPPDGPDFALERTLWRRGISPVAGVDEAGRGALAGPVVAAAVLLDVRDDGAYRDSKTVPPARREELARRIRRTALAFGIGVATAAEIDRLNVLAATHLAAERALTALELSVPLGGVVTDFLFLAGRSVLAVPRADAASLQVAAASILAKTHRDALLLELDDRFPAYGFARNKGYGAPGHLAALERHGPCAEHRRTFRPVAQRPLFPPLE